MNAASQSGANTVFTIDTNDNFHSANPTDSWRGTSIASSPAPILVSHAAMHIRCLLWVNRDRSLGAENRFMSATPGKLTQSQSLGACHEGARR